MVFVVSFDQVCNHNHFKDSLIVLIFSMLDLFEQKSKEILITACPAFTDYPLFVNNYTNFILMVLHYMTLEYIPMDIQNLLILFCGYGLNIYHLDPFKYGTEIVSSI